MSGLTTLASWYNGSVSTINRSIQQAPSSHLLEKDVSVLSTQVQTWLLLRPAHLSIIQHDWWLIPIQLTTAALSGPKYIDWWWRILEFWYQIIHLHLCMSFPCQILVLVAAKNDKNQSYF